jgi:DNA replication initiation complex subunit (GINS family)
MTPEEKMILFSVLQDIADELRRIKRKRQASEKRENRKHTEQSKAGNFSARNYHEIEPSYTRQED